MALVLWDKDGTLLIKYLTKGGSINAEYYMSLLDELKKKKILDHKRRGKLCRGILFLQDNAPLHTAHKIQLKIRDTGFNAVDQPSYSPDLPTSGYYLLPQQEKKSHGNELSLGCRYDCRYRGVFGGTNF